MIDDVRYALRGMLRSPGFTAVALLMIALGTGANAAMFSVIDGVMLQSPFTDPNRIGIVRVMAPGRGATAAISIPQYRSLAGSPGPFEAVAAIGGGTRPMLAGLGDVRRFNDECVTAGMFRVLGTPPLLGRVFNDDDDRPGAPGVVVLSYDFWMRELGGAADVLGRSLSIDGMPATIVGVMPRRFGGPYSRNNNDGWLPLGPALANGASPGCRLPGLPPALSVVAFVRLAPGAGFDGAAAQATVSAGIERIPAANGMLGAKLALMPIEEQTFDEVRTPLLALLGAVGLVLLIACANVANLQLERVFGRRRELAVRMAIGATRARVVRQTLTENVLLYIVGCAAGVLIARWTLDLIVGLMPGYVPHLNDIEVDVRVLAATFAVSLAAGLLVGVVPALQASSPSLVDDLRVSFRTATPAGIRTRRVLVVVQLALSLTLLVGAALMIRTFLTLRPSNPGFTTRDKLTASLRLQGARATNPVVFFDALLERVRSLPGVQGVTASSYLPVSGNIGLATIQTDETTDRGVHRRRDAELLRGDADSGATRTSLRCARRPRLAARRDRQRGLRPPPRRGRGARRVDGRDGPGSQDGDASDRRHHPGHAQQWGRHTRAAGALRPVRADAVPVDEPDRALGEPVRPAAGDGHPPGRRGDRLDAGRRPHHAAGGAARHARRDVALRRVAARRVRGDGAAARRRRARRGDGLVGHAAHPRDRRAHGARRECG